LALAFGLAACSAPNPKQVQATFETGVRAYDAGDYTTAHAQWLPLAEGGDLAAQRNIGHLYETGKGVPLDPRQAAIWYRKAAEAGLHRAQANLANLYLKGEGVPQDDREAAQWFHRAAVQGHAVAQYNLGVLYQSGRGVEFDLPRAVGWLQLAAKAGHPQAQEAVAKLTAESPPDGIPDSLRAEPRLLRNPVPKPTAPVTAVSDVPAAPPSGGWTDRFRGMLGLGDKREEPPPAAAPAGASQPTLQAPPLRSPSLAEPVPFAAAARQGAADNVTQGLVAYHGGRSDQARLLWEPAARGGDALAQFYLGGLYRVGTGVPPDPIIAYVWWSLAARGGHQAAKEQLSDLTAEMSLGQIVEGEKRLRSWQPGSRLDGS